MQSTNNYLKLMAVGALGLFLGSRALAVPLSAGGTVSISGSNYPATVVEDVDRTISLVNSSNDVLDTVTVRDRVTQLASGTYNFERFLLNGPSLTAPNLSLGRYGVTEAGFGAFSTDVDYDPTTVDGLYWPISATRSVSGDSVRFNDPFQTNDVIASDEQTDYMTIQTNATAYALTGSITVTGEVGGSLVTGTVQAFAPAVPEPAAAGVISLIPLLFVRRRR
jgi:hypothetical protein